MALLGKVAAEKYFNETNIETVLPEEGKIMIDDYDIDKVEPIRSVGK